MSLAENKALVRRLFAAMDEGDLDTFGELTADSYVHHDLGTQRGISDKATMREYWARRREAYPDAQSIVEDLIAEGDQVVVRYTLTGTHMVSLMGLAARGRTVHLPVVAIYRLAGGQIVESWLIMDNLEFRRQLGLI